MKKRLALYSDKRSKLEVSFYMDGGLFETSYVKPTGGSIDNNRFYNTLHVLDGSSRMATLRVGNNVDDHTPAIKYIVGDPLNNSTVVLKTSGSLINREEYYPFGETSFGGFQYKRYRYNGKEKDEESGLYEYGQRYYAPWVCRFISVDPLAAKFADLSPYNYAGNRPITKVDIDGLQEEGRKKTPSGGAHIQNLPVKKGADVKIINIPVHGSSKPVLTLIGSEGDGNTTPTAPFMTDSAGKPITVNLKPVTITAEAPGPAWAKSVIQDYQSGTIGYTEPNTKNWFERLLGLIPDFEGSGDDSGVVKSGFTHVSKDATEINNAGVQGNEVLGNMKIDILQYILRGSSGKLEFGKSNLIDALSSGSDLINEATGRKQQAKNTLPLHKPIPDSPNSNKNSLNADSNNNKIRHNQILPPIEFDSVVGSGMDNTGNYIARFYKDGKLIFKQNVNVNE